MNDNIVELNQFRVCVKNTQIFKDQNGAYFAAIRNGSKFAIEIKSMWPTSMLPFECDMELNGEVIGTFQSQGSRLYVETKPGTGKEFVAYVKGSREAYLAGQTSTFDDHTGLIKLKLYPSKTHHEVMRGGLEHKGYNSPVDTLYSKEITGQLKSAPMQIGLQGKSDQNFTNVIGIDRDLFNETVIYIRLVEKEEPDYNAISPLAMPIKKETPYPRI